MSYYLPTLRISFPGNTFQEYRLNTDCVEFRNGNGKWHILSEGDIELHYRFNTEVARWHSHHSLEGSRYRQIQLSLPKSGSSHQS